MDDLPGTLRAAANSVADLGACAADFDALDDAGLLVAQRRVTALRGAADTYECWVAGGIARHSRRELGYAGMAIRAGFASAEALIQSISGASRAEAAKLVRVGTMLAETEAADSLAAVRSGAAGDVGGDGAPDGTGGPGATDKPIETDGTLGGFPPDAPRGVPSADPPPTFSGMPAWQVPIARAVAARILSLDGADAIRRGLSGIDDVVPIGELTAAAERLIADANPAAREEADGAGTVPGAAGADAGEGSGAGAAPGTGRVWGADELHKQARRVRDQLDAEGILRREMAQHDLRSVRKWRSSDGMFHGSWRLAPEDGVLVDEAFAQILSPRRGGPRFVDLAGQAAAQALVDDPRSDEQISADAFVGMIRLAADADPGTMFGGRRPAVRVIVTKSQLAATSTGSPEPAPGAGGVDAEAGSADIGVVRAAGEVDGAESGADASRHARKGPAPLGAAVAHGVPPGGAPVLADLPVPRVTVDQGWIEGTMDPVSIESIERALCETGHIPILFDDDGTCLNVGRELRLFTAKQRLALTIRDAGCMFTGCDRPPSWCEAHHVRHWHRDRGPTDLADGILLCRRHHLMIHNNHWEITRVGVVYWLQPPTSVDPARTPIRLASNAPAIRALTMADRR